MAYTNSPLVVYTKLSPHHSGLRTHSIDRITPHCVVGQCSLEQLGSIFNGVRDVSSNYGISPEGKVGLYVEEKNRSWCTSSNANDQRAITIEVASDTSHPYTMRDAAYNSLIRLSADICSRNGKKKLLWLGTKDKTLNYQPAPDEMIITVHRWFDNKACPGEWLFSRLDDMARRVTQMLGSGYVSTGTYLTSIQQGGDSGIMTWDIDYSTISPYLVELNESSPKVDWAKLTANRVVGAMIDAGHLFNRGTHARRTQFRNPNLYAQVQNAVDASVKFGYYMTVRAYNSIEAEEEMYELSFLVRKYPPPLGVWLKLETGDNKSLNDNLLKVYQRELVRLGLKARIGVRTDRKGLDKISWDKFKDDWSLWLNDKVKSVSELDGLLTPEFFDTDGKG